MKTEDAVAHGITTTAGVVSSAALVMVGVFAVFAMMPILDMKEMGIGLAAAVLIDATIVRAVLLPATMKLLGDCELVPAAVARVAAEVGARGVPAGGAGTRRRPGGCTRRLAPPRSFAKKSAPLRRGAFRCPCWHRSRRRDSNPRPRFTRALLYQLSYSGAPSS